MSATPTVRRLDEGRGIVDQSDPVARAILELLHRSRTEYDANSAEQLDLLCEIARRALDAGWFELWCQLLHPGWVGEGFASFHRDLWFWALDIERGVRPRPYVACWSRGHGKTSSLQLVLSAIAARQRRAYGIYIGAAQTAVEDKVAGVGELMLSPLFAHAYPETATFYESAAGTKRDWRRARIRTASGFTLDAFGLDQAIRGARVDEDRPDFIVLDDVETESDTPYMTAKKLGALTEAIIPAGATDAAVVFIQNRIHADSLMAQLLDGRADFLADRMTSGPVPQVLGLEFEQRIPDNDDPRAYVITGGTPTWVGQNLETSERQLNAEGLAAFMSERQHAAHVPEDGAFPTAGWQSLDPVDLPAGLSRICRAWDLAGTADGGDYTVGVLMALYGDTDRPLVIDVVRGRWDVSAVEDLVAVTAEADVQRWGAHTVQVLESQPAAAGKAWDQRWIDVVLQGHRCETIAPQGSKADRADPFAVQVQKRRAVLVQAPWNPPFITEHAQFATPASRHDDQVDAAAMAYKWLVGGTKKTGGRGGRGRARAVTTAGQRVQRQGRRVDM